MKPTKHQFTILEAQAGRLDKALALALPDISRSTLQRLLKEERIKVDGRVGMLASFKVKGGEKIEVTVPAPAASSIKPQASSIPLDILYEDTHLLVVNKPAGMVVHEGAGHNEGTLVNALLAHCGKSLSGIGGIKRPGIVHRLDKDTSGLMVVAKTDAAHKALSEQFSSASTEEQWKWQSGAGKVHISRAGKKLKRLYHAFIWGVPAQKDGEIEASIGRSTQNRMKMAIKAGGRAALTYYETLETYSVAASRIACTLATGRTHQIRVHLAACGHSVIGDPLYGRAKGKKSLLQMVKVKEDAKKKEAIAYILAFPRQALHAAELSFVHPTSKKTMRFASPLPDDLKQLEKALKRMWG
jgi:23S rRNA pseudouridine1911/1915/1917 synthase